MGSRGGPEREERVGWSSLPDASASQQLQALRGLQKQQKHPQQRPIGARRPHRSQPPPQPLGAAGGSNAATVEELLLQQHGWAGIDTIEAVLEAAGGDWHTASALLDEMSGAGEPQGGAAAAAAAFALDKETATALERMHLAASGAGMHAADAATTSAGAAAAADDDLYAELEQQQDPYRQHRRGALRHTRAWISVERRASAASAAGDHSGARSLAAEALRLRRESQAAHAAAADRIETEHNAEKGLFELDLHGLHADEAVAALDRRLCLLHSLLEDPGVVAAAAAEAGARPDGGGGGLQRTLRVVVGRGAHSSGGEASIPRVIEGQLEAAGLRYDRRGGSIDVRLRAPAALQGPLPPPRPGRPRSRRPRQHPAAM